MIFFLSEFDTLKKLCERNPYLVKYYGNYFNLWFLHVESEEIFGYFKKDTILERDFVVVYRGQAKLLEIGIASVELDIELLFKKL